MNRLIIPTLDATYGNVYFDKSQIISILRAASNMTIYTPTSTDSVQFTLGVAEASSNATYDAFINACYNDNPGGDTTVQLPEGQSITAVSII
mgnify:FL=1|tara:strand:- start:586 stop:861 length:276 start_codon:yes stop_codon:yes gene_type:complete